MPNLADNKQALYDYQILEEFEAGLVLSGPEVKSVKLGHLSLKGSFVSIKDGRAYLKNMHISSYKKAKLSQRDYQAEHDRQLLLKKKEVDYLLGKSKEKALTIVPISVYTTRRLIKVKIALARGKKKFDKRQAIKTRDLNREIARKLKTLS
ncbi:SsrA-binding protein SmpB [Candidatus Nomurabacteria bacterium]|nr:SsrA-binding protein SmpB [Candidatus Nomurabacteria bacterium]